MIVDFQAAPYCVCIFENTEFISRGPVDEGSKSSSRTTPPQGIAIPRSRQSSSTNLSTLGKLAGAVGLTRDDVRDANRREKAIYVARNPHWEHEAALYVPNSSGIDIVMSSGRKASCSSPSTTVKIRRIS